jgi:hypothetical protein
MNIACFTTKEPGLRRVCQTRAAPMRWKCGHCRWGVVMRLVRGAAVTVDHCKVCRAKTIFRCIQPVPA